MRVIGRLPPPALLLVRAAARGRRGRPAPGSALRAATAIETLPCQSRPRRAPAVRADHDHLRVVLAGEPCRSLGRGAGCVHDLAGTPASVATAFACARVCVDVLRSVFVISGRARRSRSTRTTEHRHARRRRDQRRVERAGELDRMQCRFGCRGRSVGGKDDGLHGSLLVLTGRSSRAVDAAESGQQASGSVVPRNSSRAVRRMRAAADRDAGRMVATEAREDVVLRDGSTLRLRADDAGRRAACSSSSRGLSPESRYLRFQGAVSVDEHMVERSCSSDGSESLSLVGELAGGRDVAADRARDVRPAPRPARAPRSRSRSRTSSSDAGSAAGCWSGSRRTRDGKASSGSSRRCCRERGDAARLPRHGLRGRSAGSSAASSRSS